MPSLADIAKSMKGAATGGGGNWFKQGKGVAVVKNIAIGQKYKGFTFLTEFLIESSESFSDADPAEAGGPPEKANSPGSDASTAFVLEGDPKKVAVMMRKSKELLYALLDESDASVEAAAKKRAAAGQGPISEGKVPAEWCAAYAKTADQWSAEDELGEILKRVNGKTLRGVAVSYSTSRVAVGNKKITSVNFSHIKQTNEQIAARRAKLDGQEVTPTA